MSKKLIIPIASSILVITGTLFAIRWAKGYRPSRQGLKGTGLLTATSNPSGAQVFINNKLTTATNDTLNLPPGEYKIEIKKDGYITWEKILTIEKELVTQTSATLFPSVPSLTPLTFTGADNITPSPDGQRITYVVSDASTQNKNGLYILELTDSPLSFQKSARQIARNAPGKDWTTAQLTWSPDSTQILAHFPDDTNFLLDANRLNDIAALTDSSARLPVIFTEWEEEIALRETDLFLKLPQEMQRVATQSAKNLYFSPDGTKILYTATAEITIPDTLTPPLPATNTQPELRELESGNIYIYDLKEDKNFLLGQEETFPAELGDFKISSKILILDPQKLFGNDATPSAYTFLQKNKTYIETLDTFATYYTPSALNNYQWFPTSNHILMNQNDKIEIVEYDGTNHATLYAGPHEDSFVYPWPNGSKIIILTNLNGGSDRIPNLYSINLK